MRIGCIMLQLHEAVQASTVRWASTLIRGRLLFGIFGFFPEWGFPKIRGTILGVPIIRTIIFWGLYWGPLILGNYQMSFAASYLWRPLKKNLRSC